MKVWILFGGIDYEGSSVLGVYSSEAAALMARGHENWGRWPGNGHYYDDLFVSEWEVED